jgi:hypothetical protein
MGQKFPRTKEGKAEKYKCYQAWLVGAAYGMEQAEIARKKVEGPPKVQLSPEQLDKKIDLIGSNIQGQMFAGFDKNEKEIEELRDQIETLRGQVITLQQNLTQLGARPFLDMTRY